MRIVASPERGPRSGSYRPDIDGLRAFAVLGVVLFHAGIAIVPGGFTGVDIFFVISGYLIGGHIFTDLRENRFRFLEFYRLRAKRILPALYAVLICTLIASFFLLSPAETSELGRSATATVLSISNITFWHFTNYFAKVGDFNPLLMTWSLGVEEQFYIFVPILMVLLMRVRVTWLLPTIALFCAASFLFAWYEVFRSPMISFYLLPARGWELGIGVGLAIAEATSKARRSILPGWTGPLGWLLMIAPVFLLRSTTPFPGPAALPTVVGTALVLSNPSGWINRRVISWRPFVGLGKISYSWYLWHWPLLVYLRIASPDRIPGVAIVMAVVLSCGLATLSYFVIEQPFRRSPMKAKPLLLRYGLASLLILGLCSAFWLSHGFPARSPSLAAIENAATNIRLNPCLVKHALPNVSAPCYSPSDPRPVLAIWGDSHTTAISPGLMALANSRGYGFAQFAKGSCPSLIGAAPAVLNYPLAAGECATFNRRVLSIITADKHIQVVVLHSQWDHANPDGTSNSYHLVPDAQGTTLESSHPSPQGQLFKDSLSNAIRSLQLAGKKVIVIADVPGFDIDPLSKTKNRLIPARLALGGLMKSEYAFDQGYAPLADADLESRIGLILQDVAAQNSGTSFIDLTSVFCSSQDHCTYRIGDNFLYADEHHLTATGARFALNRFHLPMR